MKMIRHLFLPLFVLWLMAPAASLMAADQDNSLPALPPQRQIRQQGDIPAWKIVWDQGRQLARDGEYDQAGRAYEKLLTMKDGLDEACRELAAIRLRLQQWDAAIALLEILLEKEPERSEYLSSLAQALLAKGYFPRAAELFSRVVAREPENQTALAGMTRALIDSGRREEGLPILERLLAKNPADLKMRREIAGIAYELGFHEKASPHLEILAVAADAEPKTLLMAATVCDRLGKENLARTYWQRLVTLTPDNLEAQSRLAALAEKEGRLDTALKHLNEMARLDPNDSSILLKIGRIHLTTERYEQAGTYMERYLAKHPADKEAASSLVKIQAALGHEQQTLHALERYFAIESQPGPDNLRQAAQLYEDAGRFHEAIPLYRQLLALTPEDPELLRTLANDLLAIGRNDGALNMWKQLAEVVAEPMRVYLDMAGLLERLKRWDELLEVLEKMHQLEPDDEQIMLKLALMRLEKGDLPRSADLFEKLARAGHRSEEFYRGRASLDEQQHKKVKALADYEELLKYQADQGRIQRRCLQLAGELGLLRKVRVHLAALRATPGWIETPDFTLSAGVALRQCGDFAGARQEFAKIIMPLTTRRAEPQSQENLALQQQALLELATLNQEARLPFEAEQALRLALNLGGQAPLILERLFEQALNLGDYEAAEIWLNRWSSLKETTATDSLPNYRRLELQRARLLVAMGDPEKGINICRRLLASFSGKDPAHDLRNAEAAPEMTPMPLEIGLYLSRFLLAAGDLRAAKKQLLDLLQESRPAGRAGLEPLVALQFFYQETDDLKQEREISSQALRHAENDLEQLLHLTTLYQKYQLFVPMAEAAALARQQAPDSVPALFLLIEAQVMTGDYAEAILLLEKVKADFPGSIRAAARLASLYFRTGRLDAALAQCRELLETKAKQPDILLLQARILWAQGEWREAIAVYQEFLAPSVAQLLDTARILPLPAASRTTSGPGSSLLKIITLAEDAPDEVALIMAPSLTAATGEEQKNAFYSLYRWQALFTEELAARRAVQRREYFRAAKLYQSLLKKFPGEESIIFDLAGIYSRQGRLGEEAALYENLGELNPDFPGLTEAVRRNHLKRQPKITLNYGYQINEGRDNYKSLKTEWGETSVWFSPTPRHEAELQLSRINYLSPEKDAEVSSRRALLSYQLGFAKTMSLTIGGGVESLDRGLGNMALINCAISGEIGDRFTSRIGFKRDVVTDTLTSLTRNIVVRGLEGEVTMDLFPQLMLGANYSLDDYSDSNLSKGYTLWASSVIFQEPTYLRLSYAFEFKDSLWENLGGPVTAENFGPNDHPYWTPKNFWSNQFTVYFKHLLSGDTLDRGIPRYYTAEYSAGYEANGRASQSLKASFVVECTPRFLLRAETENFSSPLYRHKLLSLGATYRW